MTKHLTLLVTRIFPILLFIGLAFNSCAPSTASHHKFTTIKSYDGEKNKEGQYHGNGILVYNNGDICEVQFETIGE